MGNSLSARRASANVETPAERSTNMVLLTAAVQAELHGLRIALAAWPVPEGELYAHQTEMVQAIDRILATISDDMARVPTINCRLAEVVAPMHNITWIANVFENYTHALYMARIYDAAAQRAAKERICRAVASVNMRLALYRCYFAERPSGYALDQARSSHAHYAPSTIIATRASLIAHITELHGRIHTAARPGIDALLANLRSSMDFRSLLSSFSRDMAEVRLDAAIAECIVFLVQAERSLLNNERQNQPAPPTELGAAHRPPPPSYEAAVGDQGAPPAKVDRAAVAS